MGYEKSPQPWLFFLKTGQNSKMFRGINFASGASGLLDATGKDKVSFLASFVANDHINIYG